MNFKKLSIFFYLFLMVLLTSNLVFSETDQEKLDRYEGYGNTTYNIFIILTGIFFLIVVVTMILIVNHFGIKHLWNYIWIGGAFGGTLIIAILFKFL